MTSEYKAFKRDQNLQLAAVVLLVLISVVVLVKVENMLVSFVLAFVINYLFNPIVNRLERKGFDRSLVIAVLFALVGLVMAGVIVLMSPIVSSQFSSIQRDLPKYAEGITSLVAYLEIRANALLSGLYDVSISQQAGDYLQSALGSFLTNVPHFAQKTFTTIILSPFFAFFMLRDGRRISRQLLSLVPNNLFELALSLTHNINEQMGGFIRARMLEALIVGLVVWLGLAFMGFRYATFLAIIAAVTNLIPMLGQSLALRRLL